MKIKSPTTFLELKVDASERLKVSYDVLFLKYKSKGQCNISFLTENNDDLKYMVELLEHTCN